MAQKATDEQLVRRARRRTSSSSSAGGGRARAGSAAAVRRRRVSTAAYYASFAILIAFSYLFFKHVEPDLLPRDGGGGSEGTPVSGYSGYRIAVVLFLLAGVAFRQDYPFNVNVLMLGTLFFAGVLCGGWLVHDALKQRPPAHDAAR